MTVFTVSLLKFPGRRSIPDKNISPVGNQSKMTRVAARLVVTDMVDDGNILSLAIWNSLYQPSIQQSMGAVQNLIYPNLAISSRRYASPYPTSVAVYSYFSEDSSNRGDRQFVHNKQWSVFYDVHNTIIGILTKKARGKKIHQETWPVPGWTQEDLDKLKEQEDGDSGRHKEAA